MKLQERPAIPAAIKREVRQRCGYGCVICGKQLYDYDHMVEYNIVKCHEADNLILLCKQHHGEKTSKNLPLDIVKSANLKPYNLINDTTKPRFFYYSGKNVEVHIGDSIFKYDNLLDGFTFVPLRIDETNIISFKTEDNHLLLNFISFNRDGDKIIEIIDNRISHSTNIWDACWESNKLTLREKNRSLILQIKLEPPNIINITKGYISIGHTDLIIDFNIIYCPNNKMRLSKLSCTNSTIGLSINGATPYKESWKEVKRQVKKLKKAAI